MRNIQEIRFITANYSALQGLRMVPFNLLALLVAWWANRFADQTHDLSFPLAMLVLCGLLYVGVDQYYKRSFGQVQQRPRERTVDILISITWSALALAAFAIDTGLDLPFSALGLVFALGLLAEYVRLTLRARGPYVRYYLLLSILIIAISLLPLVTPVPWWSTFGFRHPVVAVLAVIGLFGIIAGIVSHFYLLRALHANQETVDGSSL